MSLSSMSGQALSLVLPVATVVSLCATVPAASEGGGRQAPNVRRVDVAPGLYEVAFSARRQTVYVTSTGVRGQATAPPRVLKLNPATLEVQGEIPLQRAGFGLRLDDDADRLYVGNAIDGALTVIDTSTDQVIATVQLAEKVTGPDGRETYRHHFRELVVDRGSHRLFAPGLDTADSALYVVDTRSLTVERVIRGLGFVATGAALDEDGGRIYVSNLEGKLFVFDTRTLEPIDTWNIGVDQPLNLAVDPRGKRLFATDEGLKQIQDMRAKQIPGFRSSGPGDRVAILDATSGKLLASLETGRQPIAPLLDPERNRLYVTNRGAGTVTVFTTTDYRLLHTISLPDHPNSLSIDRKTGAVFVTVKSREGSPQGTREGVARIDLP